MLKRPILYSFRRCPYAMRARTALYISGQICELREVSLRNKPSEMTNLSTKGTVPVLQLEDGEVLDESLDIMFHFLIQNDPLNWLQSDKPEFEKALALITENDGEFKTNLDRYKYSSRYEEPNPLHYRSEGENFLIVLNKMLKKSKYLFGSTPTLLDYAIFPFIRQFANTDRKWFDSLDYSYLQSWLEHFLASELYDRIMVKYPYWAAGNDPALFPTVSP